METKKIPLKTVIYVLATQIREDAETLAQQIVANVKNSNIDYSFLIEKYILNSDERNVVKFSEFADKAFDEIKETEMLLSFEIDATHKWKFDEETKTFEKKYNGEFNIRAELNHKEGDGKYRYFASVYENGNNLVPLFNTFKAKLASKIDDIQGKMTDIEVAPAPETE